ncbi:MAG: OmpA family protein [Alphaproteobacteria bacterium]|nr:OmpA family protein [Alphaproteobacteria bacterium]
MKLRNMLVAASILALPTAALAQPVDGFYVGAGIGYDYQLNTDVKQLTFRGQSRDVSNTNLQSNPGGPLGMVNVGYGFGNGLRVELEGFYYYQTLKVASGTSGLSGKSHSNNYGGFVNALYDFDVGVPWVFPYVGIGVGYMATSLTGLNINAANLGVNTTLDTSTVGSVAAQAIVGAAFPIPQVPGLSGTVDIRYFTTLQDQKFKGNAASGDPYTIKVGVIGNVAGVLGLRYQLYTPPPPPPPAPAPTPVAAPSRTYLVFFDWDKYNLTDRARQIIAEAAQNSTRVQYTRIEVNGYTDLSGTKEYNQKLSVRRAQAVAAELVKDGVPANAITAQGFGESNPLVPTAQGVREPQNRRVEIIIK